MVASPARPKFRVSTAPALPFWEAKALRAQQDLREQRRFAPEEPSARRRLPSSPPIPAPRIDGLLRKKLVLASWERTHETSTLSPPMVHWQSPEGDEPNNAQPLSMLTGRALSLSPLLCSPE